MPLTETVFLTTLFGGILCLLAGLLVTRRNWRLDVPPFGRHSLTFDIAMHPAKYANADALPGIRRLNTIGALLLAISVLAVFVEAVISLMEG